MFAGLALVSMGVIGALVGSNIHTQRKQKAQFENKLTEAGAMSNNGNGGNPGNGNNGNNGSNGNSGNGGSQCCGCVNTDQLSIINNAITQLEADYWIPSDSIIAVGNNDNDGRYIVSVNDAIRIFNKRTNAVISTSLHPTAFNNSNAGGDAYVTWDDTAERFFMTSFYPAEDRRGVEVLTPPSLAGTKPSGDFVAGQTSVPAVYNLTGNVLDVTPFDGCTPFTGPSVVGKIALISRGTCTYGTKAWNAQQAGAIGVVVYNSVAGGETIFDMACFDPFCVNITIPTQFVARSVGLAMLAAIPTTNVRLFAPWITHTATTIFIAVSKTSAPNSAVSDFYHYAIPAAALYPDTFADYPKHATNFDTLFLAAHDFVENSLIGTSITAIDKSALINGAGAVILYTHLFKGLPFMMPAENRMKLNNANQPTFFIGQNSVFNVTTGVNVLWATHQGFHSLTPVFIPTPTIFSIPGVSPKGRQPPPAVPSGLEMGFQISTAVVRQHKTETYLYSAKSHNVSAVHTVIRWWKIRVTDAWANGQLQMSQQGDYNPGLNLDVSYPHLDVDKDGNMGLSGMITGPNQYASMFYTSRLVNDPPNTLRYPPIIWTQGNSTYFSDFGAGRNRWLDYSGCQVDPSDGKTFYMFGQIPDPAGYFVNGVNTQWTTSIGTMQVNANGSCDVQSPTTPGPSQCTGSQEADHAKKNPTVWSTAAIEHTTGGMTHGMKRAESTVHATTAA
jgi:hypothetical protein